MELTLLSKKPEQALGTKNLAECCEISLILAYEILKIKFFEAWRGIEPLHRGFADRSVSTSPPGRANDILPQADSEYKAPHLLLVRGLRSIVYRLIITFCL